MMRRGFLASLLGLIAVRKMLSTAGEPVVEPSAVFPPTEWHLIPNASVTGSSYANVQVQWVDADHPEGNWPTSVGL